MLNAVSNSGDASALIVLNASPDVGLRESRAKALHSAGYYTSSAETPDEVITLAGQMDCAVAIVCHAFTPYEHTLIRLGIQRHAPTTTLIFLTKSEDHNPRVLLSMVKAATVSREKKHCRSKPPSRL